MFTYRAGVDIDNTLADYNASLAPYASRHSGIPIEQLRPQTTWSFAEAGWFRDREDYVQCHTNAVNDGMFRRMPVIEGAVEAMQELSEKGVEIVIITHRILPGSNPDQVEEDTRYWLESNSIPFSELHFEGDKKRVPADVYVDDAPHNALALREAGRNVIVFDQLYNRHLTDFTRTANWGDGERLIAADRLRHLAASIRGEQSGMLNPARIPTQQTAGGLHVPAAAGALRTLTKVCGKRTLDGGRCRRVGRCPAHP